MVDLSYVLTPFVAWFAAGSIKFIVNSIVAKRFAFDLIGYGGMPSNHSAIVSSIIGLIAVREGIASPALGVAVALAFVVVLDARSLRGQIGKQAVAINRLATKQDDAGHTPLRERIGHTPRQIAVGMLVGGAVGVAIGLAPQLFG